ncbi:MAG: hypothetical protein C4539_01080 [Ignavibacteriales bacterium]|nr:MAG: hypothetical protein C4539_01080 [Ignavibacteriales bacterium]
MRIYIYRILFLFFTAVSLLTNLSVFSSYILYENNFEDNKKLNFKHLFSTTDIKMNYAGITGEESSGGRHSLKFDFIINKNDSAKSVHYWLMPLNFVIKDVIKISCAFSLKGNHSDAEVTILPYDASNISSNHYFEKTRSKWKKLYTNIFPVVQTAHREPDESFQLLPFYEKVSNLLIKIETKQSGRAVCYLDDLQISHLTSDDKIYTGITSLREHNNILANTNFKKKQVAEIQTANIPDQNNSADVYFLPPTKYNRLTGKNIPKDAVLLTKFSDRGAPGQYLPFSLLIQAKKDLTHIKIYCSDLKSPVSSISSDKMDISIAKVWYQAGFRTNENKLKILTQELLVKDDDILKVDYENEKNLIRVNLPGNKKEYVDLTSSDSKFPDNGLVQDSDELQLFSIEKDFNKQIWFTLHIPENAVPGKYEGTITITAGDVKLKAFPIVVEVLPFHLSKSILTYGIYYHGYVDDYTDKPMNFTNKTSKQYKIEMEDLKQHGVLYPTTYQILKNLNKDLKIRKDVGLPTDKLFTLGIQTGNSNNDAVLEQLRKNISEWRSTISKYGYKELFVYGIDEARDDKLRSQRKSWTLVRSAGAKVFVAGYKETFTDMGDVLDVAVIQGSLDPLQAQLYHSKGNKIFSYSNPQAGEENPEVYRRNYGLALWKAGYDGAMDYAYQKNYGSTWNDWDHKKYRDENFTYPTADGIISTVQWEGFRAGVDDVRYLSTLLDLLNKAKNNGKNVSAIEQWLYDLNPNDDLDKLRNEIIDRILLLQ